MSSARPGVLALQGDVEPHRSAFAALGLSAREVRRPADLDGLTHLVLPGGESTTLHHLLSLFGLGEEIVRRFREHRLALFGTCAGAILLGHGDGERPPRLGLLDAVVERNAYGRQLDSFTRTIPLDGFPAKALGVADRSFRCVFIRAPRFCHVGSGARVLARDGDDPILVEGPGLLAATFHPELTDDPAIHSYFLRAEPWATAPLESTDEQTPQMVRA